MNSGSSKYRQVQAQLEEAIRSGEFKAGDQLPTEQALAERYGVSYLTARRAVCELVDADLLERRARKQGTFVRAHGLTKVKTETLNLITTAYEGALHRLFLEHGTRLAQEQGWLLHIIRLSQGQQDPAVRALRGEGLALVMLDDFEWDSALGKALMSAQNRVVSLGRDYSAKGIPSVRSEMRVNIEMAISHLHHWGHQEIALVMQDLEGSLNQRLLSSWHRAMEASMGGRFSYRELEDRVVHVKTPQYHCPTRDAYFAMRRFLEVEGHHVTAAVCSGDEVTQGVLAACYDAGRPVPHGFSVINILDAQSMAFSHPPVTSIDNNMSEQIEVARKIFEIALGGEEMTPQLRAVPSLLIERESVAAPFSTESLLPISSPPVSRQKLDVSSTI